MGLAIAPVGEHSSLNRVQGDRNVWRAYKNGLVLTVTRLAVGQWQGLAEGGGIAEQLATRLVRRLQAAPGRGRARTTSTTSAAQMPTGIWPPSDGGGDKRADRPALAEIWARVTCRHALKRTSTCRWCVRGRLHQKTHGS